MYVSFLRGIVSVCVIALLLVCLFALGAGTVRPEYVDVTTIEAAEQRWKDANITDYQLTMSFVTFGADLSATILVSGNHVEMVECYDRNNVAGCASLNPAVFSVAQLFETAKQYSSKSAHVMERVSTDPLPPFTMLIDDKYSYPRYMVWSLSEHTTWNITSFTIIE